MIEFRGLKVRDPDAMTQKRVEFQFSPNLWLGIRGNPRGGIICGHHSGNYGDDSGNDRSGEGGAALTRTPGAAAPATGLLRDKRVKRKVVGSVTTQAPITFTETPDAAVTGV